MKRDAEYKDALKRAATQMSMQRWKITLCECDDGDDDCSLVDGDYGSVYATPENEHCVVCLHEDLEPEDVDCTARHELFHALMWEFSSAAHMMAKTKAEKEWLRVAEERLITHLEDMAAFNT